MMTFLKIRNNTFIIALIWLFVYSAVIPMQLSSYVLCIGADGHVEVEFAVNGYCADIPTHVDENDQCGEHTGSNDDHCGDCMDLPIFASINTELYIVSASENPTHNDTHFSSPLSAYQSSIYSTPSITPTFDSPSLKDSILTSLRTVVLLT